MKLEDALQKIRTTYLTGENFGDARAVSNLLNDLCNDTTNERRERNTFIMMLSYTNFIKELLVSTDTVASCKTIVAKFQLTELDSQLVDNNLLIVLRVLNLPIPQSVLVNSINVKVKPKSSISSVRKSRQARTKKRAPSTPPPTVPSPFTSMQVIHPRSRLLDSLTYSNVIVLIIYHWIGWKMTFNSLQIGILLGVEGLLLTIIAVLITVNSKSVHRSKGYIIQVFALISAFYFMVDLPFDSWIYTMMIGGCVVLTVHLNDHPNQFLRFFVCALLSLISILTMNAFHWIEYPLTIHMMVGITLFQGALLIGALTKKHFTWARITAWMMSISFILTLIVSQLPLSFWMNILYLGIAIVVNLFLLLLFLKSYEEDLPFLAGIIVAGIISGSMYLHSTVAYMSSATVLSLVLASGYGISLLVYEVDNNESFLAYLAYFVMVVAPWVLIVDIFYPFLVF